MTDRTHPDSGELDGPGIVPKLRAEIKRLRAELDALKAQKPVYYAPNSSIKNRATTMLVGMYAVNPTDVPLYAHPVPSVPDDEYIGWYCSHCERGVDASEVTYHEQHTVCGRVITHDRPPKQVPSVPARLTPDGKYGQQHHYACGWNDAIDFMLEEKEES